MSVDPQRPQGTEANVAAPSDPQAATNAATDAHSAEAAPASGILISFKSDGQGTGSLAANDTPSADAYAHLDQGNLYPNTRQEHPPQPLGPEGFQATSHRPAHLNRPVDHFRAFEEFQEAIQGGVGQDNGSNVYHDTASNGFGMNADMATVHFGREPYLVPYGSSGPIEGAGNGNAYSEHSYVPEPYMRDAPYENAQGSYDNLDLNESNGYQEQDENDVRTGPESVERLQYMSKEKRALIEARLAQERPNRTLFVRNLDYNANVSELKKMFDEYGDIQKLFSRIENRGMVFITYGTLFVYLKGATNVPIVDDEMQTFFAEYGDIKSIRTRKNAAHQRFVEFFDARACARAYHQAQGRPFNKGVIDVKFAWDMYKEYDSTTLKNAEAISRRAVWTAATTAATELTEIAEILTARSIAETEVILEIEIMTVAAIIGTETVVGRETEAPLGEQLLTAIKIAIIGTRAVTVAMIEDVIEAVIEVVVVVAIAAEIGVVIEMDMIPNAKDLRKEPDTHSLVRTVVSCGGTQGPNQGVEQKQYRPPPAAPAPPQPYVPAQSYQPFLPVQSPAVAPSYNPLNLSAQERMEQAQKTQQFVNDILFNAGKPSAASALSMFGQMPNAMAPPMPPAHQFDPRMPTSSAGMPPAAPSGTHALIARSQAPSGATSGYPQGSSAPGAHEYGGSGRAPVQSVPVSSQPPPVAPGPPAAQKASAEAQVQQLLQLLVFHKIDQA
ncbi:hypothetical protein BGZ72_009817 [Mortierella alpina]|nr:hypothetical protein BGZ72_009817 [Mortierella alpina]